MSRTTDGLARGRGRPLQRAIDLPAKCRENTESVQSKRVRGKRRFQDRSHPRRQSHPKPTLPSVGGAAESIVPRAAYG